MANKKLELKLERGDVKRVTVPKGTRWRDVAQYAALEADNEEAVRVYTRTFAALPWEGAFALQELLTRSYSAVPVPDRFQEMTVPSALGEQRVIWGCYQAPGVGQLDQKGRVGTEGVEYVLTVRARKLEEAKVEELFDSLAKEIGKHELYRGRVGNRKAVALLLPEADSDGDIDLYSPPQVIPIPNAVPEDLILKETLFRRVNVGLFGHISRKEAGRRGVLLAGLPGTGKTLTCKIAARLALDAGRVVFYMKDSRGLEAGLRIAARMQPSMLQVEDLDRQLGGNRTDRTDRILQALDGIGSADDVVFMATTNDASTLPEALVRDGRMSSKFIFELLDADAAERLLRSHLGSLCPELLNGVGKTCAGMQPASIAAVAEKSHDYAKAEGRKMIEVDDVVLAIEDVRSGNDMIAAIRATHEPESPKLEIKIPELVKAISQQASMMLGDGL